MLVYLQAIDDPQDRTRFEAMYSAYRGLMFHMANRISQTTAFPQSWDPRPGIWPP